MFTMENRNDLIRFEHNGKVYAMTEEEIEAAYRYQKQKYLIEDAKDALEDMLNTDNSDGDIPEEELRMRFLTRYGVTYDYAMEHIDTLIELNEKWDDWEIAATWLKRVVNLKEVQKDD